MTTTTEDQANLLERSNICASVIVLLLQKSLDYLAREVVCINLKLGCGELFV
jgi:hypothetical protein